MCRVFFLPSIFIFPHPFGGLGDYVFLPVFGADAQNLQKKSKKFLLGLNI